MLREARLAPLQLIDRRQNARFRSLSPIQTLACRVERLDIRGTAGREGLIRRPRSDTRLELAAPLLLQAAQLHIEIDFGIHR